MKLIYDLARPELESVLEAWGESAFRAAQVWEGLYRHLYDSPAQFTNLSKELRARLAAELKFSAFELSTYRESADASTRKSLLKLHDGQLIEAVLMRYEDPADSGGAAGRGGSRRTLCISTQAGCAMGCVFCATGQMGFKRNLSSGEIVAQVLYYARMLREKAEAVTNVVLMGMGEPFHNYENSLAAIDRLNDAQGFNLGARRFTISTVGLVPQIKRFADEGRQVNLAISLHATDDTQRVAMMPVNKRHKISAVLEACRYYIERTHRRVTFEWALIDGVNDSPEAARKLALLLKGMLCHVNAIPLNPTDGYDGKASSLERARKFKSVLEAAGIACTIRMRRGIDIAAGCGQLAAQR